MNLEKLKILYLTHKITILLIVFLVVLGSIGFVVISNVISSGKDVVAEEVELIFDAEGPYALLHPRRDGNALILDLKRTSSYDEINYELAYTSDTDASTGDELEGGSIDRGVVGTIDTKERKGEYEQEILFGTCSRNVCKYDKGVENGTLTLRIKKGNKIYKMVTQWHLQQPDVALGMLTSGDNHFVYTTDADRQTLSLTAFTIVNDVTGVPKLPSEKEVLGKVYALNVPIAKQLPSGTVSVNLAENPPDDAVLARYDFSQNKWIENETKIEGSKLITNTDGAGIFAVLVLKK